MNSLQILEAATLTMGSPKRFQRGKWVTRHGGCSLGHIAVAASGGDVGLFCNSGNGGVAKGYIGRNPEARKAVITLAQVIAPSLGRTFNESVEIVIAYNDNPMISYLAILRAFEDAVLLERKARQKTIDPPEIVTEAITEGDIFEIPKIEVIAKPEPVPTLDFSDVDGFLAESAEKEELVAV